ncbi:HEPN domain-containing protein [Patescibacteria group bacterium]|nr:HEPN domain-containing protein [Patescibacteria group bacterium]
MNYQEFVKKGLLKKEEIGFDKINQLIEKAYRKLKSAQTLVKDNDEESSFQFAYEAMLLAGRALVFSYNFRPRTIGSHKIVVDFTAKVFGNQYKTLVYKFDRMRKKRNYLIYGIGLVISKTEAENAIKTAEKFVKTIKGFIQKKNPQEKLI